MIKRFIIIATVIGMLASCSNPVGNHPKNKPVKPDNKTFIVFDNTQGICTVSVYEDYRRRDEDKVAEITAGENSGEIGWTAGESVPFYFSYRVTIKDINDFSLNYVPETGRDQKTVRIDADATTTIKIPTLSGTFSSPDTLLSNNSYLIIQNNTNYSFKLHQGTSELKPDNINSPLVNNGERAQYTVNPGPASNYRLLVGADYFSFPVPPVNFEAGYIYSFDFNGDISLVKDIELRLENVNGVTVPQPPAVPVVIISNESIALQWDAVKNATAYEIWVSTENDSASASKYGIDVAALLSATISGLNNGTTYYFWLKAKNILGTSGFSPAAIGTPSASPVKPPDPQTAPSIVAENGQLGVSWQAVKDASVYEIWTGTTNTAQNATKRGGDVSGFSTVITGLDNGTTYYIWVKAKNNIGVSGFSPSATGKPLGTPGPLTVSSGFEQLLVAWTAVAGADEYEVYYGIGTATTFATTTGTTATITGLIGGTTYYIRIRAKNANGVSDYGPNASGVPNDAPTPGLYRGMEKIGTQNLAASLTYISANAVTGDNYYIVLGANESISPSRNLYYSGKTVGITLLGYGGERTITLSSNGSMFIVISDVTLTLEENITLSGRSANNASLVSVTSGGKLIMNNGAKISDNVHVPIGNTSAYVGGGGVNIGGGTFTMSGGEISGNRCGNSSNGGGVYVYSGTFTMSGGKISGNSGNGNNGGGVCLIGGIFTMSSGEISLNKNSYGSGGGVYIGGGTFTMSGGGISRNECFSGSGGGVYIGGGTFTMNGGEISGNSGSSGGGVYVDSGTFTKSGGGTITGYASDPVNGNVVKNYNGIVQSDKGHAVFVKPVRRRESTAWPGVNMDSKVYGVAGGWEN